MASGALKGLNAHLAYAIFAIAFGSGFQHGYNTGVLNAPQGLISKWIRDCDQFNDTAADKKASQEESQAQCNYEVASMWGLIVSAFCIGGVVGGSLVGLVSERIGRRVPKESVSKISYRVPTLNNSLIFRAASSSTTPGSSAPPASPCSPPSTPTRTCSSSSAASSSVSTPASTPASPPCTSPRSRPLP